MLFIHRWTGLLLSLYAVVIGITGSLLVFRDQLAPFARPQVNGGPFKTPLITLPDEVVAIARQTLPGYRPLSITWPYPHSPNFHVFCIKGPDSRTVFVDAQTAKLVGVLAPRTDWLGIVDGIHGNLLLGRAGRLINGYAAILTMLLCLTGLYIWWPNRQQWQTWLRWRGRRTWWRVFWDFHHLAGVVTFAILLVIAATGTYFTWNQFFVKTVSSVFARSTEPKLPVQHGEVINPTLGDLAWIAQRVLPGPKIHRMALVDNRDRPMAITMREGEPDEFHLVSTVYLDPRTGETVKVKHLPERPPGDGILGYISAVHFGVFGGMAVKLIWFAAGLALAGLSMTGTLLWWRGLKRINMGR